MVEHDLENMGKIVRGQKYVSFFEVVVDEIEDFVEVNVIADDVIPAIGKGIFDGLPRGFGEREVDAGVDGFFYTCRGIWIVGATGVVNKTAVHFEVVEHDLENMGKIVRG